MDRKCKHKLKLKHQNMIKHKHISRKHKNHQDFINDEQYFKKPIEIVNVDAIYDDYAIRFNTSK